MSVRKNDQRPSSFGPLDTSLKLITHTFNILSNEKVFIPRYQKFIDKIAAETAMIYHKCRVANKLYMRAADPEELKANIRRRLTLQREALELIEDLNSDIMISQKLFHLKASKVRYWTELTVEAERAIAAWHKSDKTKYGS